MQNEKDENKDAFRYGIENNRIEMLKMMIDNYQISLRKKFIYKYIDNKQEKYII